VNGEQQSSRAADCVSVCVCTACQSRQVMSDALTRLVFDRVISHPEPT
jgi:hypothetical protein